MNKILQSDINLLKKKNIYKEDLSDKVNINVNQYKKIKIIKKKIFNYIVPKIEKFNNVKYNKNYWKIILYPWLDTIIPFLFLRWNFILKKKNLNKIYDYPKNIFIQKDFDILNYNNNYHFNKWILGEIINFQGKPAIKRKVFISKFKTTSNNNLLFKFLNFLSLFLPENKFMFKGVQISFFKKLLLCIKLREFPNIYTEDLSIDKSTDINLRKFLFDHKSKKKNLENFIKKNLIYLIPKNYLENYKYIVKSLNNSHWPKKVKLIITSYDYWFNDFFKIWVAEQKFKNKSKYIILQHGGKMGTEKIISNLATQIDISDKFITWGWKGNSNKIIPFYSLLTSKSLKINYLNKKKIFFFQKIYSNYFSHIDGSPYSLKEKILSVKKLNEFFNLVNKDLKKNFILRFQEFLAPQSIYFYKFLNRAIKKETKKEFTTVITDSRICVHDSDTTAFLETLSYNIPTLTILNKNYINNLSIRAKKYYKLLKKNNILFTDIKSASMFLNDNYNEIDKWWENKSTQETRIKFCRNFINRTYSPVKSIFHLIKKV